MGDDTPVARVDRDDQPLAELLRQSLREGTAPVPAVSAVVPRMTRAAPASRAAWTASPSRSPPPIWTGTVAAATTVSTSPAGRPARERPVEVDDVEPLRALGGEASRRRCGIAALDRHLLAPALEEPDTASFEDVQRGDDGEAGHAVVLAC